MVKKKKKKLRQGIIKQNQNGGLYQSGRKYQLKDRTRVAIEYLKAEKECFPKEPSINLVAKRAGVSWKYAKSVKEEVEGIGYCLDPEEDRDEEKNKIRKACGFLKPEHEIHLLTLQAENPARSNIDYVFNMKQMFGHDFKLSPSSVSNFFLYRFDHKGNFKKANLVPLDKFKMANQVRYLEYMIMLRRLPDHTKFKFFDEKHLMNKDVLPDKVRANPINGMIDVIPVSGDFRDSWNLIAGCTCDPSNGRAVVYAIGKLNGTAEAFMAEMRRLIVERWLVHNDVVVMDNCRIHTGGEATVLKDMLWNYEIDGRPLRIITLYLPTRSPELNPIELVFHILVRRIKSYRVRNGNGPVDNEVVKYSTQVLDDISFKTVANCYLHCGY